MNPLRYLSTAVMVTLFVFSALAEEPFSKTDVFVGGEDGYHTYRIPALVVTNNGTVLAFCEARKNSDRDQGDIDLALKRSVDGGKTWGALQLVHEDGGNAPITIGNPCPIIIHDSDTIHLLFTRNNKRLFYTRSTDEGRHWAAPEERTPVLKGVNFPWLRIGAGPGHGIQLRNERLIVPLWYCDAEPRAKEKRYRAGIVYSDDEGTTWQPGGLVPETIPRLNECTVIERSDGSLLLNMRAYKAGYRATAESNDGGETWSEPTLDPHLPDPTCQGSILRLRNGNVLFTNIPGAERAGLSVRLSEDEGKSWKHTRLLEAGPSAYSDLAQRADGRILCLFEWGTTRYNEQISLATFPQSWVQDTK